MKNARRRNKDPVPARAAKYTHCVVPGTVLQGEESFLARRGRGNERLVSRMLAKRRVIN
jgi:hypothetical protein